MNDFYIIVPYFNPVNYQSRIRLHEEFVLYIERLGINIITVELAFGNADFQFDGIQYRSNSVIWHKERLINLAVQQLPSNWKYLAWIDGDIKFLNDNWLEETITKLQIHPIVQMFEHAIDLSPSNNLLKVHQGLAYANSTKSIKTTKTAAYHSGFAWACTRAFFNQIGGLIDYSILGSGDRQMADAFIGKLELEFFNRFSEGYKKKLASFAGRASTNLGYTTGSIVHYWHGSKTNRQYFTRQSILSTHKFDPDLHLVTDWNGLYRLTNSELETDVIRYFMDRSEDDLMGDNVSS